MQINRKGCNELIDISGLMFKSFLLGGACVSSSLGRVFIIVECLVVIDDAVGTKYGF